MREAERDEWVSAVVASWCDVPALVAEVERMALRYADLVAACRAGLVADLDGDPAAWDYVTDELPPPPTGHRLWQRAAEQGTTPATGWPDGTAPDPADDSAGGEVW